MVTFKDIADRVYTTLFTDYKLDKLVQFDEQAFYDYLGGFLCNSIDMFDGALYDLSYSELTYSNSKNGQQQKRKKENNNE